MPIAGVSPSPQPSPVIQFGVQIAFRYGLGYLQGCLSDRFVCEASSKFAMLATLSYPTDLAVRYAINRILPAKTPPILKIPLNIAAGLTAISITAVVCKTLGYDVDAYEMLYKSINQIANSVLYLGGGLVMIQGMNMLVQSTERRHFDPQVALLPRPPDELPIPQTAYYQPYITLPLTIQATFRTIDRTIETLSLNFTTVRKSMVDKINGFALRVFKQVVIFLANCLNTLSDGVRVLSSVVKKCPSPRFST